MDIQKNYTQYQEEGTKGVFDKNNSSECEETFANLMDKKNSINEEVRNLKRENDFQSASLCEIKKLKRKIEEDKVMI